VTAALTVTVTLRRSAEDYAKLADSILQGIGRILHENALAGPDQ
jgi:hypothetical protein